MNNTVVGILPHVVDADNLVTTLQSGGIPASDISVLFPDKEGTKDFAHKNSTKAPEGAAVGGTTGGIVGGTLGLLAGIGALAIPGVGPLIAAGPIMATLSGVAVGASVGSLAGALTGLGIPEYEAKLYEGKIRDGNILVAATCRDNNDLKTVEELFKQAKATDIHRVGEEKVKR